MRAIFSFLTRFSLHEGALLLGVLSLAGLQMHNFAGDPGVGWHLATGQWISELGTVPRLDPFLASSSLRPWVSDQWLSDLILFQLFTWGSWPLIYAVCTGVYLFTFFVVLPAAMRRIGISWLAATAGSLIAFKVAQIHFILRPVLFSFLFFTVVWNWILESERNTLGPRKHGIWLWMPALFAVWSNVHPSFVLGLFLLAARLGWVLIEGRVLRAPQGAQRQSWKAASLFAVLLLVCFGATLLNPQSLELHRSILALQQSDYFMQLHDEWRPITLASPEGQLFAVAILAIGLSLVARVGALRSIGGFTLTLLALFTWATSQSVRMLPFWGIVAAFPLAVALQGLGRSWPFEHLKSFKRLAQAFLYFEQRERGCRGAVGAWGFVTLALIVSSLTFHHLVLFMGPFGPPAERFPYQALERVLAYRERQTDPSPLVVASGPEWGGFITHFGRGLLKPVIDDRNTLIGEEFYRLYEDRIEHANEWKSFLALIGADVILLPPSRPLIAAAMADREAGWTLLYEDPLAVVLVRNSSQDLP